MCDKTELRTSNSEHRNLKSETIKLAPLDANKNPKIIAEGMQEGKVNYFIGSDPKDWKTNIPTYDAVLYENIYKGVDMKFYGNNRQMEYDIIVKPSVDPSIVQLSYEGIEGLSVTKDGKMEIALKEGKVIQNKPYCYQEIEGKRVEVVGSFKLINSKPACPTKGEARRETRNPQLSDSQLFAYAFDVPSYDKRYPLIIDPVLAYSTFLGGSLDDRATGIAVDGSGNVYVTGWTTSLDFPTNTTLQPDYGGGDFDAYVTKLNAAGTGIVYSTYLGGDNFDSGHNIFVDNLGNIYIIGISTLNFPTTSGAFMESNAGNQSSGFVAKLNPTGSVLIYSTYLGGPSLDSANTIAVDNSGNAYVVGWSRGAFPTTTGAYQETHALNSFTDVFVAKLNAAGSSLIYSTFLGGDDEDHGFGIAIDASGHAYVTGSTKSTNFPTMNPIQPTNAGGISDAFVTKLNSDGSELIYSTYLGGSDAGTHTGQDIGSSIAVDGSGNAYVTGNARSGDFPTVNPILPLLPETFVAKLNAAGSALVYSTYTTANISNDIALDSFGNAYMTGRTGDTLPLVDPVQAGHGGGSFDAFVMKVNADGSEILFSTYLGGSTGGSPWDSGGSIAVDGSGGNVYVTGTARSSDFPTVNAIQPDFAGGTTDAFVAKISFNAPPTVDAGINVQIDSSEQLSTILDGNASDTDGDPLTYRWLEGATELLASTPVVVGPPSAPLDLSSLPLLSVGMHTLTLEANDGTATANDDMILTIENSPPVVAPSGGGTFQLGDNITLGGQVADFDGDGLNYSWKEGTSVITTGFSTTLGGGDPVDLIDHIIIGGLPLGNHIITLEANDGVNTPVSDVINVDMIDTTDPTINATVSPGILWPPNHQMVDVVVQADAADNSGSVTLTASVSSSEPPDSDGDGNTIPDYTTPK